MAMPSDAMTRENCNKVLQSLTQGDMTRYDVALKTHISQEQASSAMFHLKQEGFLKVYEKLNPSTRATENWYGLTDIGRRAAPPKFVKDLAKYDSTKNGYKHVHGVAGKFDYCKPLRGGLASLYDALVKPMSLNEWSEAANMEVKPASVYATKLVDLGIVICEEEPSQGAKRTRRVYRRDMEMLTAAVEEQIHAKEKLGTLFEQTKPLLVPAIPNAALIEKIAEKNSPVISNFSKPNPTIDEALAELNRRFTMFEIMLAALARLEPEYKRLVDFQKQVEKQFGDLLK